ncbi:MAG TPA: hypothetical protein VLC48_11130 [Gemmatimonadota bacterium]|nr:hypothetical protein [Gemmatimonadota bacterium]
MTRYLALLLLTAHLGAFTAPAIQSALAGDEHPCALMMVSHGESKTIKPPQDRHGCCEAACDDMFTCTAAAAALVASVDIEMWAPPTIFGERQVDASWDSYLASPLPPPPEA